MRAAGAVLAGGHTITDPEPKYGLAVLGLVHPDHVLTNRTAQPGDALVLTKPIGVGVVASALKRDLASDGLVAQAVTLMTTSNATARDAAVAAGPAVHAATDVTGFGLLGHLREMVVASGVSARVDARSVPVLEGVRDLLADGVVPGGTRRNHAWVSEVADWGAADEVEQLVLADAQTSGGLLLAVAPDAVDALVADLGGRGTPAAAVIGHLTDDAPGRISVAQLSGPPPPSPPPRGGLAAPRTRRSPWRRVMPVASSHPAIAMVYLRLDPSRSRRSATASCGCGRERGDDERRGACERVAREPDVVALRHRTLADERGEHPRIVDVGAGIGWRVRLSTEQLQHRAPGGRRRGVHRIAVTNDVLIERDRVHVWRQHLHLVARDPDGDGRVGERLRMFGDRLDQRH